MASVALAEKVRKTLPPPRWITAGRSLTVSPPAASHAAVGLLIMTGVPVMVHRLDICTMEMLVPRPTVVVLRPGEVAGAVHGEGRRVQREGVQRQRDTPLLCPAPGDRVRGGALQDVGPDVPDVVGITGGEVETYHLPSMKWISGAQMCAPIAPLACLV